MSHKQAQLEATSGPDNRPASRFPTRDNRDAPRGRMTGPERGEHPSDSPATDRDIGPSPPVGGLGAYRAMIRLDGSEVVDIEFRDGALSYDGNEVSIETLVRLGERIADAVTFAIRARMGESQRAAEPEITFTPSAVEMSAQ